MDQRKKLLFLLNPNAGKSEIRSRCLQIIELFSRAGYLVTVAPTAGPGEIPDLVRQYADSCDLLVTCGGDGTLNETVSGLMQCSRRPPLGYLPAGTMNDFAFGLGLSRDFEKAAHTAINGTPFDCDVGRFGDRYFTYVAAFGAFTDVAYQTPQQSKNLLGRAAYILEGIKRLPRLKGYRISLEHDGEQLDGEYIFGMVSSATSVGGIQLGSFEQIALNDGVFEVLLVKNPGNMLEAQQVINAVLLRDFSSPLITTFHTSRLSVAAETDTPWTLDGEFGGSPAQVEIENMHLALRIMV